MGGLFWPFRLFLIRLECESIGLLDNFYIGGDHTMKFRSFVFLVALLASSYAATRSFGQYQMGPAYGAPLQAGFGQGPAPGGGYPGDSFASPAGYMGGGPMQNQSCAVGEPPCDGHCESGCSDCCGLGGGFEHCWYFYGEFLYLRPRDSEVAWAAPIDGPIIGGGAANPIQIRPLGVADMDYQPGWRGGIQYNTSECSGFNVQYALYEASTNDSLGIAAPNVIRSLVSHPGTQTAAQDFLQGDAHYNINYNVLDFDYRKLVWYDYDYQVGYLAGIGAVQLEQTFVANFAGAGTEQVQTDIDFYGAGGRFGLFGEYAINNRFRFYSKGTGSWMAGEFRADYDQRQSFDPQVVDTAWKGGRIVGIYDLEFGMKWISRCGNYSANVGYLYSAWTNVLQTDEWIKGVRTNSFIDMDSTMTFDGLVARFEARF